MTNLFSPYWIYFDMSAGEGGGGDDGGGDDGGGGDDPVAGGGDSGGGSDYSGDAGDQDPGVNIPLDSDWRWDYKCNNGKGCWTKIESKGNGESGGGGKPIIPKTDLEALLNPSISPIAEVNAERRKTYNTTSCPCDFMAEIDEKENVISCERDWFGKKQYVQPVVIKNHFIDSKRAKINDRWACNGYTNCGGGQDFDWDTLYVININESKEITRPINTNSSRANCHILPRVLNGYSIYKPIDLGKETLRKDPILKELVDPEIIHGKFMFSTRELCEGYDSMLGDKTHHCSEFFDVSSNSTKYVPGKYYPTQKIITSCFVNKVNDLVKNYSYDWKPPKTYASKSGKTIIPTKGGNITFKIKGENNPMFTITIKDSSGYSVLEKEVKNVVITDENYTLIQKIPALVSGKTHEVFTYQITPSADTSYYYASSYISAGVITGEIWQFRNPKFTFEASDSSLDNTLTTQTAIVIPGIANDNSNSVAGFYDKDSGESYTHTTTIERSSGSDKYYINKRKLLLSDVITKNNIIKMTVKSYNKVSLGGLTDSKCQTIFQVAESPYFDGSNNRIYNGELEIGMNFTGSVKRTSTIRKSIDLNIYRESRDRDDELRGILTNKFEIDSTRDLTTGMEVTGENFSSMIESIDDGKTITLTSEHVIDNLTDVTFTYRFNGNIIDINADNQIVVDNCIKIPNKAELFFEKANLSDIRGRVGYSKSGDISTVITTTITNADFGQDDVTFTLDPDLFITNKPNAYDQNVIVGINSTLYINFIQTDCDWNATSKVPTITRGPINGTLAASLPSAYWQQYTPHDNFRGRDSIKFTMSDGVNASEEKTIYIIVK